MREPTVIGGPSAPPTAPTQGEGGNGVGEAPPGAIAPPTGRDGAATAKESAARAAAPSAPGMGPGEGTEASPGAGANGAPLAVHSEVGMRVGSVELA